MNKIKNIIWIMILFCCLCACTTPAPSIKETYVVNFYDYDGTLLQSSTIQHGDNAIVETEPSREGYTFIGWDQSLENITSDLDINALYEITKFTVKFLDYDGTVLKEERVERGKSATAPADPVREDYEFLRWDRSFNNVKSDLEINAVYRLFNCTVTFLDYDGTILKVEKVQTGQNVTPPDEPTREGYKFIGWDQSLQFIRKNMTITAVYELIPTSGTVKFYDGKTQLDYTPSEYVFGESFILPVPSKDGYEFIGWFLAERSMREYTEVTSDMKGDLTFYARWVEVERNIVLPASNYKFTEIKKMYNSSTGVTTYNPVIPSNAPQGVQSYTWTTSDETIATVSSWSSISGVSTGYCILTARNINTNETINCVIKVTSEGVSYATVEEANNVILYDVTFKGKDGEVIKETVCEQGGSVIYPAAPTYEGYKFVGWDQQNFNIQSDVVINAMYEEGIESYAGKSFAVIGDSISTYKKYIPAGFSSFYPYPTADVTDVNKTWWMQVINGVGGTLLSNNSYSGTCVAPGTGNETSSKKRLEYTLVSDQAPDVILVFIGANDCASVNVGYNDFSRGYKMMIDELQKLCPDSEIVLCTLPTSPFYSENDRIQYNDAIRSYAEEYGLKLVDVEPVDLDGHLVDSAHPDTSGMTLVANQIIKELLK